MLMVALVAIVSADGHAPARAGRTTERRVISVTADLSYEVLESDATAMRILVIDRSGRNASGPPFASAVPAPDVAERRYPVQIRWPQGVGKPTVADRRSLLVIGMYRRGLEMDRGCEIRDVPYMVVCVGFFLGDNAGQVDFADSVNMPGDVSRALDVIFSSPLRFGAIDPAHVLYSGYSLGGVVGFYLVHPILRDQRITAFSVGGAMASPWMSTFREESTWRGAPPILMSNGTADEVIPYELARRTYRAARPSAPKITLLTLIGAGHSGVGVPCRIADEYRTVWEAWRLGAGPRPSRVLRAQVAQSECARLGVVAGGTTGYGAADPYVPRPDR